MGEHRRDGQDQAGELSAEREGVIKFEVEHSSSSLAELIKSDELKRLHAPLAQWRARLMARGMLGGDDPARYGGAGFGNLSARLEGSDAFLITASQTGHLPELTLAELSLVERADLYTHKVVSVGERLPSSEALTHAALYALSEEVRWVFHVHAPELWRARALLTLPTTPSDVAYGTHELVEAVERLAREGALQEGVFAMGGHEDGLIAFGAEPDEVGERLLSLEQRLVEACRGL